MEEFFRIGFLNIGGFPEKWYKEKNHSLRKFIDDLKLDCIGITETNVHWKSLKVEDRLQNVPVLGTGHRLASAIPIMRTTTTAGVFNQEGPACSV